MALLAATAQVLRNALAVLGVSAPPTMSREAAPAELAACGPAARLDNAAVLSWAWWPVC